MRAQLPIAPLYVAPGAKKRRTCDRGSHGEKVASPFVEQLTRSELEVLRVKLEAMSRHELETFYKATHDDVRASCRSAAFGDVPLGVQIERLESVHRRFPIEGY